MGMRTLQLRLLGVPEVLLDGKLVSIASQKSILLLAYLCLEAKPKTREHLADSLWQGSRARANLRMALHGLQQALPGVLEASRESVRVADGVHVTSDLARLEVVAAHERAELIRGPFLDGIDPDDGVPLLERWLIPERTRLAHLETDVRRERARALRRSGELEAATAELELLLARLPWDEEAYCDLMRIAMKRGSAASALQVFKRCVQALESQVQAPVSARTQELADRIARARDADRVAAPVNPPLGRSQELEALLALLRGEEARLIVLTGPAGVGKTVLARAVAAKSAGAFLDGATWVACGNLQSLGEVVAALGAALRLRSDRADRLEHELRGQERLLVLDDFDGVASKSKVTDWLVELLHAAPELRVLVTSRLLLVAPVVHSFEVGPLEEEAAAQLFSERWLRLDPRAPLNEARASIVRLSQRVGRHPLALELAAAACRGSSPERVFDEHELLEGVSLAGVVEHHRTLEALFAHACRQLPEGAAEELQALAVFCAPFDDAALDEIVPSAAIWLQLLRDHSLLGRTAEQRHELHPVVRELGWRAASAARRKQVQEHHARHFAGRLRGRVERLLRGDPQAALEVARDLDDTLQALRWAASHDAALCDDLERGLSPYFDNSGQFARGIEELLCCAELSREARPEASPSLFAGAARLLYRIGNQERALALCDEIQAHPCVHDRALARVEDLRAMVALREAKLSDTMKHNERARSLHARHGDERGELYTLYYRAHGFVVVGRVGEGERVLLDIEKRFGERGDAQGLAFCSVLRGRLLLHRGHHAEAKEILERMRALCEASKAQVAVWVCSGELAQCHLLAGELVEARSTAETSLRELLTLGEPWAAARSALVLVEALLEEGDGERALEEAERGIELCRAHHNRLDGLTLEVQRARAEAALGRETEAREALAELVPLAAELDAPALTCRAAAACCALLEESDARELASMLHVHPATPAHTRSHLLDAVPVEKIPELAQLAVVACTAMGTNAARND